MGTGVAAPSGGRYIVVCDHQPHRVGEHARGMLGLGLSTAWPSSGGGEVVDCGGRGYHQVGHAMKG